MDGRGGRESGLTCAGGSAGGGLRRSLLALGCGLLLAFGQLLSELFLGGLRALGLGRRAVQLRRRPAPSRCRRARRPATTGDRTRDNAEAVLGAAGRAVLAASGCGHDVFSVGLEGFDRPPAATVGTGWASAATLTPSRLAPSTCRFWGGSLWREFPRLTVNLALELGDALLAKP